MFQIEENARIFDEPNGLQTVMRYLTIGKFFDLIESSSLYFSNPATFNDPYEATLGSFNLNNRNRIYSHVPPEALEQFAYLDSIAKNFTLVSCWSASESESNLMCATYAPMGPCIVLASTWSRLTGSITDSKKIYGGYVKYVDYDSQFIPEGNLFSRHTYKRIRYQDEREVRLLIPFDKFTEQPGMIPSPIRIKVDLKALIERLVIVGDPSGSTAQALSTYLKSKDLEVGISNVD